MYSLSHTVNSLFPALIIPGGGCAKLLTICRSIEIPTRACNDHSIANKFIPAINPVSTSIHSTALSFPSKSNISVVVAH